MYICANCGTQNRLKTEYPGSCILTFLLLSFFFIPGILYILWCTANQCVVCRVCGSTNLIPVNSPIGKKLIAELAPTPPAAEAAITNTADTTDAALPIATPETSPLPNDFAEPAPSISPATIAAIIFVLVVFAACLLYVNFDRLGI